MKGRPLGVLALWLQGALGYINKAEHVEAKTFDCSAAYENERRQARRELWAMRDDQPLIVELFDIEAKVPVALLGRVEDDAFWGPASVF